MPVVQMMRYGVAGTIAVAVHYAVLIGLVELAAVAKLPASIAGFCLAVPVNYYLQHSWVFKSDSAHTMALPRYLVVTFLGLAINAVVFKVLLDLGVPYLLAQAVAIVLVTGFNFVVNRSFTFGAQPAAGPRSS